MRRLVALLMCAVSLGAAAQSTITYPYNPDGNADGDIAVGDLQDFLVTYGNPFSPSEVMVGDSSLTYWVEQLSQTVQEQQEMIDSLSSTIGRMSLGDTEHFKFYELTWEGGANPYRSILDFDSDGFVRLFGHYELEWIIVPDTTSIDLYANLSLAYDNFIDSYFFEETPKHTIPLNSNEKIVLFGGSQVLEQGTNGGEMNVFWTPVLSSNLNSQNDDGGTSAFIQVDESHFFDESCFLAPLTSCVEQQATYLSDDLDVIYLSALWEGTLARGMYPIVLPSGQSIKDITICWGAVANAPYVDVFTGPYKRVYVLFDSDSWMEVNWDFDPVLPPEINPFAVGVLDVNLFEADNYDSYFINQEACKSFVRGHDNQWRQDY